MSAISTPSSPNSLLSCRNDIENKVYSRYENIRAVSSSYFTICGLSCTDFKIYALLITGRLFQTASLVVFAASTIMMFTVGLSALTGVIAAAALGIIGTAFAQSASHVPFIPGQPIGLRNYFNDCWLNSSLQLLINAPAFRERMRQIPVLSRFLDNYATAEEGLHKVAPNIDTHEIRRVLSALMGGRISPGDVQEDAAEFLALLFADQALYAMEQRKNGGLPEDHSESLITLPLGMDARQRPSFEELFSEYFSYQNPNGTQVQMSFKEAPKDLLIQFQRFVNFRNDRGMDFLFKINDPLNVPHLFTAEHTIATQNGITKKKMNYEPRAFLVHSGKAIDVGHYTAFVKKGQSWWLINDRSVHQVTESTAMSWLPYCYILHYSEAAADLQAVPNLNVNPQ